MEWTEPGSNRRHQDFQSCALPTELSVPRDRVDRHRVRRLASANSIFKDTAIECWVRAHSASSSRETHRMREPSDFRLGPPLPTRWSTSVPNPVAFRPLDAEVARLSIERLCASRYGKQNALAVGNSIAKSVSCRGRPLGLAGGFRWGGASSLGR